MFNLDIKPISLRLKNNRNAQDIYIEKTIENINTLRGFIKRARTQNPSEPILESACMFTKHIQELLVYVSQTWPNSPTRSDKLVAVIPMNKDKRVRFAKPVTSSSNIPKQTDSLKTKYSNKPLLTSTGVKPTTSASGSKPSGNTKNSRTFTIVGNKCPLTRITSTKVVPTKETSTKSVATPTQGILVYNKRPKATTSVGSSSKVKIVESKNSNSKEPKQSYGSTVFDVSYSSLNDCTLSKLFSGLVPNIPSSTLYVSPTTNDWEILFQPIFDEYLNPPPCVDPQVLAVIEPEPTISISTPSSTTIDQDAPSTTDTLMVKKSKLDEDPQGKAVDPSRYLGLIGTLMYLTASRHDLVSDVCMYAQYQAKPTQKHLHAVKRIFRYLRGTINMGIWYPKDSCIALTAFADADHTGCQDTRKSTFESMQLLGDRLVSWSSKKLKSTAISSAEAKYIAFAIALCCNNIQHSRSKHIDIRDHFIKEQVENMVVELYFVRTKYQLAEIFTKPLARERLEFLIKKLGMQSMSLETLRKLADEEEE
nr:retrovirus-related Pol polyprotein from transposon TNT 1-94 [Tanacetum cinerariifolium]